MLPQTWPRWILILLGIVLAVVAILLGLVIEPAAQALWPEPTPTPTLPAIAYARPLSGECENCHFSQEALLASAGDPDTADQFLIDPASLWTPHGRLGCVTCHGGNGQVAEKAQSHEGLMEDLSEGHPQDCLVCHRSLPDVIPEDRLRTPHGRVAEAAWEGSPCAVHCSDCHGAVGHGFDPVSGNVICSMSVCLDCHQEQGLEIQMTDCDACHIGPHDVAAALSCNDCHISTARWDETALQVHPMPLTGRHAEIDCFDCHQWPNFKGLDYVCSDCHQRPHEFGNDDCALCHAAEGWKTSADALVAGATGVPHPVAGREDCRSCHGVTGETPIPEDHRGRTNDTCLVCHEEAPAPAILHPLEEHEACLGCHGEGQVAEFPVSTHRDQPQDTCQTCHVPAGVVPLSVTHSLEGREDCLSCHQPGAVYPYPATHEGWGNDLCLLCHEAGEQPTEAEHTFPQDHNAAAGNCVLCHPGNDFSTYHCDTCHAPTGMEQVHAARGITEIGNRCILCHPTGEKPGA